MSPEERQRRHEEEMLPRPFTGIMEPHLKEGSLVRVNTVSIRYRLSERHYAIRSDIPSARPARIAERES